MKFLISFAASFLCLTAPAQAAELIFEYSGFIDSVVNNTPRADISFGEPIKGTFKVSIDDNPSISCLSLGGGSNCSTQVFLENYSLNLGSKSWNYQNLPVILYLQNDVFGQDALGFAYTDGVAGPFDSTLMGMQFQGRFASDVLTSSNISADLPFALADWSAFAFFQGPAGRADLRGPLSLKVDAVSPVPEPSTWLLMILGFGFIGYKMRSTKLQFENLGKARPLTGRT